MRRILAIASISMHTAFRSKVVLTMMGLLILVIIGIPLTIKGDGTIAGYIRILIDYTLNFVLVILSIATIWAGCAAISQEVDNKCIQMTMAKPVHAYEVWLGKWIGLLVPTFLLVLFSGVVVYGILMWNVRPSELTEEEQTVLRRDLLVGRTEILPQEPAGLQETVDAMIAEAREEERIPPNVAESELRKALRMNIIRKKQTCPPGETCRWKFDMPELPADRTLSLLLQATSSRIGGVSMPGKLTLKTPEGNILFSENIEIKTEQENQIDIPGKQIAGEEDILMEYENLSENDTAIFPPDDSVQILGYAGSFEATYLRTLLIMFFQLALLAAIAVTMGAIFSTPVAAFTAIFAVLLVFMNGYIHRMAQRSDYSSGQAHQHGAQQQQVEQGPSVIDTAVHSVFVVIDKALAPMREENALELCSTGRYVSWRMLGRVFLYRVVLYCGVIGLLGVLVFRRRELALPQR